MTSATLVTASLILTAGVIDDFRSRKFHNWLFLACTAIGFAVNAVTGSWLGVNTAVTGFVVGIVCLLPLVLIGILGAGDMKLLAAFGSAAGWSHTVDVAILSLIWGTVLGLIQVIINRQFFATLKNVLAIVTMKDRTKLELHKIPFTVAVFFAWLTQLVHLKVL